MYKKQNKEIESNKFNRFIKNHFCEYETCEDLVFCIHCANEFHGVDSQ